jgi:nitrogen regulatory protein PII/signal recognition particle receptor subunit beta
MKTILIIGAANSGKKTILNKLRAQEDVEFQSYDCEKIVLKDQVDYLLRLSGENQLNLINERLDKEVDGIIYVVNNRAGFTDDDQGIIDLINEKNIPHVIFANKQDLKSGNIISNTMALVIPTIATKGIGINDGLTLLLEMIESRGIDQDESREINQQKSSYHPLRIDEHDPEICKVRFFLRQVEFENVKKRLESEGFGNITITNIKYVDKALEKREIYRTSSYTTQYPEKVELMLVTMKENIHYICQALASIKSDDIDDHLIISPVENVIRIRTREEGENAIE